MEDGVGKMKEMEEKLGGKGYLRSYVVTINASEYLLPNRERV